MPLSWASRKGYILKSPGVTCQVCYLLALYFKHRLVETEVEWQGSSILPGLPPLGWEVQSPQGLPIPSDHLLNQCVCQTYVNQDMF